MKDRDYAGREPGAGGSKPKRKIYRWQKMVKVFALKWGEKNILDGQVQYFVHMPDVIDLPMARFSHKTYYPIGPIIWKMFPEFRDEFMEAMKNRNYNKKYPNETKQEWFGRVLGERIHKMFIQYDGKTKGRCISDEHPSQWVDKIKKGKESSKTKNRRIENALHHISEGEKRFMIWDAKLTID